MSEWTSVAERLPKPHETVLVIRRNQREKAFCGMRLLHGERRLAGRNQTDPSRDALDAAAGASKGGVICQKGSRTFCMCWSG